MASAAEQLAANMNMGSFAKATELHKRLLFTIMALLIYRIGTYVPVPGINSEAFLAFFQNPDSQRGVLDMVNMFSGGAVERFAVFALNVMPYISASIIVQLMGAVYPPWEKLKKEGGESGRKQLNQYTRYLTVFLALAQSFGIAAGLNSTAGLVDNPGIFFIISTVVTLTGGTMFLMWLGEQVTARGVGNGISLIIFAGIVAVLPSTIARMLGLAQQGQMSAFALLFIAVLAVATVVFIVFMERAQRRLLMLLLQRHPATAAAAGHHSRGGLLRPVAALLVGGTALHPAQHRLPPAQHQLCAGLSAGGQHTELCRIAGAGQGGGGDLHPAGGRAGGDKTGEQARRQLAPAIRNDGAPAPSQ